MSRCETTRVAGHRPAEPAAPGKGSAASAADGRNRGGDPPGSLPLTLAAIYARVSTDRQEQQATVQSQVAALRQAAAQRGYGIVEEFVDEGYSGAHLDRPALDRLRDLASEGAIEVVLVYPDRLARQYAYQVVVLDELRQAGCEVVFLNHAFGTSPEEQMLLQIQGVFAEYERALIKERMRRGRLFAARQGRVNWGGNPPYGYRYIPKTDTTPGQLVVHETEAEIVRQLFNWLIEEEMTTYAIAGRLNVRGVPTRGGQGAWRQSTVSDILRKDLYRGETHYNRRMVVDAKRPHTVRGFKDQRPGNRRSRAKRPTEEWIPIQVPAIIDPETWELAQRQLELNRQRAGRNNTQHAYLLRGLLVCGRCGRRMTGVWNQHGGRYVCSARYPRNQPLEL
jgi:site-specific DNA recombinase